MAIFNLQKLLKPHPGTVAGVQWAVVQNESMTVVYYVIEKGSVVLKDNPSFPFGGKLHSHSQGQLSMALEGAFGIISDGKEELISPGTIALFSPNDEHGGCSNIEGETVKGTVCVIEVMSPIRTDIFDAYINS
jgi:hypothetical protein